VAADGSLPGSIETAFGESGVGSLYCNMMPIYLWPAHALASFGTLSHKTLGLPDEYSAYEDLIRHCAGLSSNHLWGTVAYLTVQESEVEAGDSQRRAGLPTAAL